MQTEANPTEMLMPRPSAPCRWGVVLTMCYPEGTTRHPRVLDRVERELGRICAIDESVSGVRLSFGARGQDVEAAREDRRAVKTRLLDLLGLPETAVVEDRLTLRHGPSPQDEAGVSLALVPNLPLGGETD